MIVKLIRSGKPFFAGLLSKIFQTMGFSPITGVWVIGLGNSAYADLCSHNCFLVIKVNLMSQMYKDFQYQYILSKKLKIMEWYILKILNKSQPLT